MVELHGRRTRGRIVNNRRGQKFICIQETGSQTSLTLVFPSQTQKETVVHDKALPTMLVQQELRSKSALAHSERKAISRVAELEAEHDRLEASHRDFLVKLQHRKLSTSNSGKHLCTKEVLVTTNECVLRFADRCLMMAAFPFVAAVVKARKSPQKLKLEPVNPKAPPPPPPPAGCARSDCHSLCTRHAMIAPNAYSQSYWHVVVLMLTAT